MVGIAVSIHMERNAESEKSMALDLAVVRAGVEAQKCT